MRETTLGVLALGCLLGGCGSKVPTAPTIPDCTSCTQNHPVGTVRNPEAGTNTEPEAGAGESGVLSEAGSTSVMVTLALLADEAFAKPTQSPDTSRVVITSYDPAGNVVTSGDAAVKLPAPLDGVATGPNWFAIEDGTMAGAIAPTLEPADVAADQALALSAIDAGQLAGTKVDGVLVGTPLPGRATVILVFRRANQPAAGITVTGNPGDSAVGYDTGNGLYQTVEAGTNTTGEDSTVLINNVPVAAQFPQFVELGLKGAFVNQASFDIPVRIAQGFVTWKRVDLN
jgi:hypothetical protein